MFKFIITVLEIKQAIFCCWSDSEDDDDIQRAASGGANALSRLAGYGDQDIDAFDDESLGGNDAQDDEEEEEDEKEDDPSSMFLFFIKFISFKLTSNLMTLFYF